MGKESEELLDYDTKFNYLTEEEMKNLGGERMLIIEYVVGYMLKVLKSKKKINDFNKEFNAIRHGDYKEFLNLVKGEVPLVISYYDGIIRVDESNPNYECDFEGLIKSGPSLEKFYKNCFLSYGKIIDDDISEEIYHKLVIFEIAIRMHANNNNLLPKNSRCNLNKVIDILSHFKNMSEEEIKKLHQARIFVNMVKHFDNQFPSWSDGIKIFKEGFAVLEKYEILIEKF